MKETVIPIVSSDVAPDWDEEGRPENFVRLLLQDGSYSEPIFHRSSVLDFLNDSHSEFRGIPVHPATKEAFSGGTYQVDVPVTVKALTTVR